MSMSLIMVLCLINCTKKTYHLFRWVFFPSLLLPTGHFKQNIEKPIDYNSSFWRKKPSTIPLCEKIYNLSSLKYWFCLSGRRTPYQECHLEITKCVWHVQTLTSIGISIEKSRWSDSGSDEKKLGKRLERHCFGNCKIQFAAKRGLKFYFLSDRLDIWW